MYNITLKNSDLTRFRHKTEGKRNVAQSLLKPKIENCRVKIIMEICTSSDWLLCEGVFSCDWLLCNLELAGSHVPHLQIHTKIESSP